MSRLLTVKRVAEMCSCSEKTVRRAIAAGRLAVRRLGGGRGVRVPEEAVEEWAHAGAAGEPKSSEESGISA